MRDILSSSVEQRSVNDLLRLYLQFMVRKWTYFDATELAIDRNWANASLVRNYANRLDQYWDPFVRKLQESDRIPDLTWSPASDKDNDRPGLSDKHRLKRDLERLAVQLETAHLITHQ